MTVAEFRMKLAAIKTSKYYEDLKRSVAKGGLALIHRCFEEERDPYGKKWKYVPDHPGHSSVEDDSGAMKNAFRWRPLVDGIQFFNSKPYARRQNFGWKKTKQPARLMMPNGRKGMPSAWTEMIQDATRKMTLAVLGR